MTDKKAFTLAEMLIVLVILGVIASITIPAVVRRQVEAQNRTRIKKAMTVYDTAINKMVVENGIKSNDALINEFNADKNNNSCAKSRAYFKVSQEGANDCTFRASDGVWWNIEDITHPIIAFNEDDLTDEIASGDTNKAFKLVGYLDGTGILRVGDLGVATDDNKTALSKIYNFVNNKKLSEETQNMTPRRNFYTKYLNNDYQDCKYTHNECLEDLSKCINCKTQNENQTVSYFGNNEYIGYTMYDSTLECTRIIFDNNHYSQYNVKTYFYDSGKIKQQVYGTCIAVVVNGNNRVKCISLKYNFDEDGNYTGCTPVDDNINCQEECKDYIYKCE